MTEQTEQYEGEVHLTTEDLAERFQMKINTIRQWRKDGKGPDYIRLGDGKQARARYPLKAVIEYEKKYMVKTKNNLEEQEKPKKEKGVKRWLRIIDGDSNER